MKTVQTIKCLSIKTYLAEQGLHPTKDNPRYGLYLSTLRKEHTPSFYPRPSYGGMAETGVGYVMYIVGFR